MTPLDSYQSALDRGDLDPDETQRAVISLLDTVCDELLHTSLQPSAQPGFFSRLFKSEPAVQKVRGLYLWGGVGRGKTLLTDMFFHSVPFEQKSRLHFHRFMQMIHNELRQLGDVEEPLAIIADQWISKSRLLVLDEMHVNDITDAMLLGGLLTQLFDRGMTMITTSNVHPDDLFKGGLQRDRFVPAIEQIKLHTLVHNMGGDTDYRLRVLENAGTFFLHTDNRILQTLSEHFHDLAKNEPVIYDPLALNSRELAVVKRTETLAWFDFDALCNTPRSTHDYIEIATLFSTLIISDVPVLDDERNDEARRLVNLIDELYDRNVNLLISAASEPEKLYTGKRLEFEFVRAASRLREMQTKDYLARGHLGNEP